MNDHLVIRRSRHDPAHGEITPLAWNPRASYDHAAPFAAAKRQLDVGAESKQQAPLWNSANVAPKRPVVFVNATRTLGYLAIERLGIRRPPEFCTVYSRSSAAIVGS